MLTGANIKNALGVPPRPADSLASIDPESVAQSKETIGLDLVF